MAGPWKEIVGRGFSAAEFAEYAAAIQLADWRPAFTVVHNTSRPTLAEWPKTPGTARMRNLERYYRDELKWSAGPHLFIAADLIWVFTPLTVRGVHSPSWNGVSWGVELVGEYETETFCAPLKDNAIAALTALHRLGALDPQTLRLHKEDPLTSHKLCPGHHVVKSDLVAAVTAALAANNGGALCAS